LSEVQVDERLQFERARRSSGRRFRQLVKTAPSVMLMKVS
jgi:hypothetical protein